MTTEATETTATAMTTTTTPNNQPSGERGDWSDERIKVVQKAWSLDEKTVENLKKLGEKLSDVQHWKNDARWVYYFLRYEPDVNKAEQMFRDMIEWRKKHNVDTILEDYTPHPILEAYFPQAMLEGLDKEGRPVVVDRLGAVDVAQLYLKLGAEEMYRYAIWCRERTTRGAWMEEYEKANNAFFTQFTYVEDLSGFNMAWHFNREAFAMHKPVAQLDRVGYPEMPVKIIVSAPTPFRITWAVVKWFVSAPIRNKIEFVAPSSLDACLEEYMDLEILPPSISKKGKGKTKNCPLSKLDGGPFPEMETEADKPGAESGKLAEEKKEGPVQTAVTDDDDAEKEAEKTLAAEAKAAAAGTAVEV